MAVVVFLAVSVTGCSGVDGALQPTVASSATLGVPLESTRSPIPAPTPISTPTLTLTPTPNPSRTPRVAAVPNDLTTVADDGEVTIAEAQAIIDIQTEIYNAAIIELSTRPVEAVVGGVGASFTDEVARIYVGNALDLIYQAWDRAALGGFEGGNTSDPTGVVDTVEVVTSVQPNCIEVRFTRDFSGIAADPATPTQTYWTRMARVERLATNSSGWHRANETNVEPTESFCDQEIPE